MIGFETLAVVCKTIALLMFFPFFVGVGAWALWKGNKTRFEAYAQIPLRED